jgi:hypothetical protein
MCGLELLTVPLPFCAMQVCAGGPSGDASTVTSYAVPLVADPGN